jgi:predicted alpha/beta hydrolase
MDLKQESLFIPFRSDLGDRLHLKRFWISEGGPPALLVHGSIENGRIFYSNSGKGLAPFLAKHGMDVYVADLRGRGLSTPKISRASQYGQNEAITEDIPAFVDEIVKRRGEIPQYWIGHSWGGVLLASSFARIERIRPLAKAMIFFGTKRCVRVQSRERWFTIDLIWNTLSPLLAAYYGYLPAKEWRLGSDNETPRSLSETIAWVKPGPWTDPTDHFDYAKAIQQTKLPPILSLVGSKDYSLGHPSDAQDFLSEMGATHAEVRMLEGYGHIDMLTSREAEKLHFEEVLNWITKRWPPPFG